MRHKCSFERDNVRMCEKVNDHNEKYVNEGNSLSHKTKMSKWLGRVDKNNRKRELPPVKEDPPLALTHSVTYSKIYFLIWNTLLLLRGHLLRWEFGRISHKQL